MGWIDELQGQVVGIDTAPLIYLIERHPIYRPIIRPFFEALDRGDFRAVTSTISLVEVLVHPLRRKDSNLAQQYREILLASESLTTIPLDSAVAERAAALRADHQLKTPDAIQLATSVHAGATYFLTNDDRLPQLPHLQMLVLDDPKV